MYLSLIKSYLTSINNGAVPNIENAWNYICKDECLKALNESFEMYERTIKEILIPKIPTMLEDLKHFNKIAKEAAVEIFKKKSMGEVG